MLRHRLPSSVVMVAWLLLMLWLDARAAAAGWLPGGVLVLGVFAPFAYGASREIAVLFAAVGRTVGAATLGGGAAAGLLVALVGAAALAAGHAGDAAAGDGHADALLVTLGLVSVGMGWAVLLGCSRSRSAERALALVAGFAVGFLFIGLLTGSWLWVRALSPAPFMVLAMLVVKSCDVGAYFTGRYLGRHKLILWLSPGKTREGLAGGMTLAGLIAAALWWATDAGGADSTLPEVALWVVFACGAVLGLAGQVGDLFASALKRAAGVKDFARTIPGFGGVMDVGDSVLLAGPLVAVLLRLAEAGLFA
ncbi:phosphatidate cytidylyltransferase [Phycisphaera mikurensis]|uniref:Phosphatidate cytidylyltransferase n=1 Tax=Phycisphaera mikurensis (strain NBRC 102666 / KCTC 22515 / FYK2301M01) TaxID=1142394 RepID=I0IEV9_PHYMF|nr:phosphatidate cytidylyltransferase [Phycisphaera mikurensis]MBB6441592.1 phosphatidate cytidylyltransferase [Phycisphaera mikurensis]BAM03797.1 putative phosphatidate cytidyltransferase [Phycisphaera mikurensis NBRC 102666]